MNHLTAITQVTNKCNQDCRYCYVSRVEEDMSKETFDILFDKLTKHVSGNITIVWHGGEPLLRGLDFFQYAHGLIKQKAGNRTKESMQTNGTLITEDVANFLIKNNISYGISLDGPKDVHDANRYFCNGKGSFDTVMKRIAMLKKMGQHPSGIAVITKNSLQNIKEIYNFFNSEQISIKVNPVDVIGRSNLEKDNLSITPEEYGNALTELFDIWYNDKSTKIKIINLFDAMKTVAEGRHYGCLYSDNACGKSFIGVTPGGDIYPCSRFSHDTNFKLGNILNDDLEKIFSSPICVEFSKRNSGLEECLGCKFKKFCNSGCPSRAFSEYDTIEHKDYYCTSTKIVFAHIQKVLKTEIERGLK